MSNKPIDYPAELRRIAGDLCFFESCEVHECRDSRILIEAADLIERLTPPKLTLEEAVNVMNKHGHRNIFWYTKSYQHGEPEVNSDDALEWYDPIDAIAIAEKLIREKGLSPKESNS